MYIYVILLCHFGETHARTGRRQRAILLPLLRPFPRSGEFCQFCPFVFGQNLRSSEESEWGADYCCHYPEIKGGENNRMITKAVPSSSIVITQNNVKTGGCSQTDRQKKKTGCSNALPRLLQPYFIDTTMDSSLCLLVSSATGQPEL